jgi:hypothetical protein
MSTEAKPYSKKGGCGLPKNTSVLNSCNCDGWET